MPMPIIPLPAFPDVPIALGVPAVLRPVGALASVSIGVALLIADDLGDFALAQPTQWGLFDDSGAPVIVADSVAEVEFRKEDRIATAPQEQGAFMSYNKVAMPFAGRVSYVQATSAAARAAFLQNVLDAEASLDLYTLVMPEFSYASVNVVHHDFRRIARRGVSMLVVDVWIEEVRVTGNAQFTNSAQSPQGARTVQDGQVQGGIDGEVPQPGGPAQATVSPPSNPDIQPPKPLSGAVTPDPPSVSPMISADELH